jgi:hypothetical protein
MKAQYKCSRAFAQFCLIALETAKLGETELGTKTLFRFLWNFCTPPYLATRARDARRNAGRDVFM